LLSLLDALPEDSPFLQLDPLPPASAEAFLETLLGDHPSLVPLTQLLIARTEGNPFFLEESVRTLVEMGVLAGTPGAYRLLQPLQGMPVPLTAGGQTPPPDRRSDWDGRALCPAVDHCGYVRGHAAPRSGAPPGGGVPV